MGNGQTWQVLDHREQSEEPEMRVRCGPSGPELWVPGRHVLAVFEVGAEWLLFADHDSPFEESLEICLLSRVGVVDQVSLAFFGWASAGIVPERIAERVFGFAFPATRRWRLEVGARLAPVRPRLGVHRHGRWLSRLWLSGAGRDAESP
ncbi:MAG: hypothetical protein CVT70_13670 [Alphaproteobacteria bacterium HGW-Alphaproteobacteria-1]|jgi:hypothetical protein|nr:MAG: hypothetical protein CVT70_13670 [Alphaproteobacteria bacterium HGW-Alphaproteobacteria-1]